MAHPNASESSVIFREAQDHEDDLLSRILCNAFMPLWNHNWFHGVSHPLQPVVVHQRPGASKVGMTHAQACRVRFYLALIRLTRLLGGSVYVTQIPHSESSQDRSLDIGSVLLWLPPKKTMEGLELGKIWKSGFLSLLLPWNYGPMAFHRIDNIFEANISKMFSETLLPRGVDRNECGFVQMAAANTAYAGKGYASALLKWQVEQHFKEFPGQPVILDTTTEQGIRAYQRLGFELLAEKPVDTGTDAGGFLLGKDADDAARQLARKTCVQWVMIKMP